jgi:hypothetical protein
MFRKYFFKRKFLKILREEVYKEQINIGFASTAFSSLRKINEEREIKICELEKANELIKDSHEKADRDLFKKNTALIRMNKDMITANDKLVYDTEEAIGDKKEKIETYKRKIAFVKSNF